MPKEANPDNKVKNSYKSVIETAKKWNAENTKSILLRVPKEWVEYVTDDNGKQISSIKQKALERGYNSVNDMICTLLSNELGLEYTSKSSEV